MATFDDLNLDRSSEWPSTPPVRHRPGVVVALTLIVLAGAYAAVSPWIIGFAGSAGPLAVNDLIIGLMVALLGAGMAASYARTHGMTWVLPVMGAWLIVAPWLVQDISTTAGTIVSNIIVGAVIVVCGLGLSAMGSTRLSTMGMGRTKTTT